MSGAKTNLVIYHANCADGFAAAWAAWLSLGNADTEYVAWNYGTPVKPDIPYWNNFNRVFIVDFSFPRDQLVLLCEMAEQVYLLDHHKTAQADLTNWPDQPENLFIQFDMSQSGAMLSWKYFHPYDKPAPLINYVQDRDLWRWELMESRAVNAYISTLKPDFNSWTAANALIQNRFNTAVDFGEVLLEQHQKIVDDIVKTARPMHFHFPDRDLNLSPMTGLAANCTGHFASDVGNELAKKSGTFGATYCAEADGSIKWSLRSIGDYDVTKIAKFFGGGGHKNAAGFTLRETGRDTEAEINLWIGDESAYTSRG